MQQQIAAEFDPTAGVAADPIVAYMGKGDIERAIDHLKTQMIAAALRMDFLEAAMYRDEILKLQKKLEQ